VGEDPELVAHDRVYEEDYGILWKHTDAAAGTAEARRSRRLVISSFATVSNYDYGFFWYFYLDYLDGTIAAEFASELAEVRACVRGREAVGHTAAKFDAIHSIQRAVKVGSVDAIIAASQLRPAIAEHVDTWMRRGRLSDGHA
jgi:hypothetical protein